jgi:2-polyprenyl-3-methyl-5-hydroxy-6-metoxy-1,4-benzoquinol methylase
MISTMTTEDASLWEPIARDYELHATSSAHNALYDRPAMLELCGDVRGLRVLDVGCGPGLYAEQLVEHTEAGRRIDEAEKKLDGYLKEEKISETDKLVKELSAK